MDTNKEPKKEKLQSKFVETYAEDMARVIGDNKEGIVKKIIQEQAEKKKEKESKSPESKKNKIYMFLGFFFMFFALIIFGFFLSQRETSSVVIESQFNPLIFNDKTFFLKINELSKDEVISSVLSEVRDSKLKSGDLEGIYLIENKQIVGLREFITTIEGNLILPEDILVSDSFMFGVVNNTETKDFFILLKMRSFIDIFDSMRAWESKMFRDLYKFWNILLNKNNAYLLTKDFEDNIIENKNARTLYSDDGEIILTYVFADDNSIVIADTVEAIREVIFRLSNSKVKK